MLRQPRPLDIVERNGDAVALAWPGTGSLFRAMHRIDLARDGCTRTLCHPGEAAYVVATGAAAIHGPDGEVTTTVEAPAVLYVPAQTPYVLASGDGATIFGGPCPPDPALYADSGSPVPPGGGAGEIQVFDPLREGLPIPMISRQGRLVVWPGIGAEIATMVYVILEPGDENDPHAHEESDDTIAILEGKGSVDNLSDGTTLEFEAGDVVFVRAGIRHKVKADRDSRIVAAGGPCPPDYGMLRAIGAA
ncbi:MAG TPA: cupin domain-containing protein [Gaiellaceae bacterium]|nr:cupin domain-containing protein [Gaiellaceae bacterium]